MLKSSLVLMMAWLSLSGWIGDANGQYQPLGLGSADGLVLGAFNLRIFGQKKLEDQFAMNTITQIILRYDMVLLQEIRDSEETAIYQLLEQVNSMTNDTYEMCVSERLGRSVSKEQYAYMYRSSKLELISDYTYNDTAIDLFEREPYIAQFKTSQAAISEFAVVGIHTKPSDAWKEIEYLTIVHEDVKDRLKVNEIIFAGDFNGDCSYVPNYRWEMIGLRNESTYKWLIEDDVDTTVSRTNCAYDRFVITGSGLESAVLPCSAGPFKFDAEYGLTPEQAMDVSDHYPIEVTLLPPEFKDSQSALSIAAFNIQIFGETKGEKDNVMDVLAKIVKRYDLILIQEIREITDTAVEKLLELSNKNNPDPFTFVISERLGRTSSKEQYAYFYRPSKLEFVRSMVYDDSRRDVFQREPFLAHFKSPTTYVKEFVIAGIHTQPDEAVAEIDSLVDVYNNAKQEFKVEDVILTGDFNADCTYVSKRRWADIRLKNDSRFCWLINNDVDTTVKSTDCAYDRFVIAGSQLHRGIVPYSAKVFRFDQEYGLNEEEAAEVSDHYPIELYLRADEDNDLRGSILRRLVKLLSELTPRDQ